MHFLQHSHSRSMGLANIIFPFFLGFLSLSFQIFLMREFSAHFYGNEISYGLILAAWLLWGGVGSIVAKNIKTSYRFSRIYYLVAFLFPLTLVVLRFSRYILQILPGQITGLFPIFIFSLVLSLFISFPFGLLFVLNVNFAGGNINRVYLYESLGACAAGLTVYLLFIPFFSNWQGITLAAGLTLLLITLTSSQKKDIPLLVFCLTILIIFTFSDFPFQKLYWKPFHLKKTKDTPYGKLQMIKTEEQLSLYNNSLLVYSYPDKASCEESIHFALLQQPEAVNVLLIGGGVGGGVKEALKYPFTVVDYVELDPGIINLSKKFLPREEVALLGSPRVHTYFQDGRAFLERVAKKYDIIILNLPLPTTAQLNRFYTREFFLKAKEKLVEKGIFSFRISSAENYISSELRDVLSTLYFTLRGVFQEVKIVPGATNIFLASNAALTLDFEKLGEKITALNLNNTYVSPHLLFSRLNPLRIQMLRYSVVNNKQRINEDLKPICYFYTSVLWSTHFKNGEKRILTFFSALSVFWLLDLPLIIFILVISLLLLRKKSSHFYLLPVTIMGLTTIMVEIIIIIAFQTFFGYLYSRIALLFTAFMAGLFLGAFHGQKRKTYHFVQIILLQFGFLLILILIQLFLHFRLHESIAFLLLLLLGFLGGDLFIVANQLYLQKSTHYGLGYGLDLLGSFIGALAASSLLIPLVGLPLLLKYLLILNSFCLLFSVAGLKLKKIL